MRSPHAAAAAALAMLATAAPAGAAIHTISPGETLSGIAGLNRMSAATLAAANGLTPDALVVAGRTLQIPAPGATAAAPGAGGLPAAVVATPAGAGGGRLVAPGETLSGIAAANGLSTAALAGANGLSPSSFVIAGTRIRIPAAGSAPGAANGAGAGAAASTGTAAGSTATGGGGHRVQPGETLSGIAAANGLSTAALAGANGLSPTSFVIAGTRVRIPARGAGATATAATTAPAASGAPTPMGGYTVQAGDTLSALAVRSRISAAQIAYANGLSPDALLIAGRVLKLPTGSAALAGAPATVSANPVPAAPTAPPQATGTRVTSGQIATIAAQQGVPASLASAIAWQESGFNNGMVSSASARGVMQVMPGTWDWVQTYLAGGRRLNPFSAEDNVRAGTLYLRHLLQQSGGDPALAAAGYYQGLASVRRSGMLPETRQYVANVLALRGRFGG